MTGRRFALAVVLRSAVACARSDAPPTEVAVGKPIPPYAATTLEGKAASIADQKGKVVLLNVCATWCAPCREEIPYLQSLYDQHAANGLEVIGVSVDASGSEATIRDFRTEFGMRYPIWLDPDERVQTLYMALGVPASYLIDREGVLRWKHLGTVRATDTSFTKALGEVRQARRSTEGARVVIVADVTECHAGAPNWRKAGASGASRAVK
jgi:cytochrome c-type biogenesis protein